VVDPGAESCPRRFLTANDVMSSCAVVGAKRERTDGCARAAHELMHLGLSRDRGTAFFKGSSAGVFGQVLRRPEPGSPRGGKIAVAPSVPIQDARSLQVQASNHANASFDSSPQLARCTTQRLGVRSPPILMWERGDVDSERTLIFEIVEESVTKEDEWTVRFEQWPPAEPGEPILELTLEIIGETPGDIGLRVGNRYAMKDVPE
jgi:hypothetical protein